MFRLLASLCSKSLFALVLGLFSLGLSANGELSGSWYDPERNGEGFHIEIWDEGQALAIWFTYPGDSDPAEAEQAWILGVGTYGDNTITIKDAVKFGGPVFGPNYDKGDLQERIWGDLTFTFQDNTTGKVVFDGADGAGEINLTHLSSIAEDTGENTLPVAFSGSWYDPDTNGQGWFIEVLSDETAIAYWFTYDENGNQAWNLGVGFIDGNRIVMRDAIRGVGTRFGEGFVKEHVEFPVYVEQILEFNDCQSGSARYRTKEDLVGGTLPMVRLTGIQGKPCQVLTIEANEGGYIAAEGEQPDCLEGRSCLVNLSADNPSKTITAVPRPGQEFKGWEQAGGEFCSQDEATCVLETTNVEGDASLAPVFEPEGSIFFPPRGSVRVCRFDADVDTKDTTCTIENFEKYGQGPLDAFVVTNPDIVFVDVPWRKQELAQLPDNIKNDMCWAGYLEGQGIDLASYTPVPPADIWDDAALDEMTLPVFFGRFYYDYLDDPDAAGLITRSLSAYAKASTWLDLEFPEDENRVYNLGLHMAVYLRAWKAVRNDPVISNTQRAEIDQYLHGLARLLTISIAHENGASNPDEVGDTLNHAWSRDLAVMMYGIMTGNDALFQVGIARYFAILDGLVRPDGSHVYESQRAGAALHYSLNATAVMIRMAELAANQGYDLYSAEVNGIGLHKIVEFHISVLEDETLIHPYSGATKLFCTPEQCDNWDRQRGNHPFAIPADFAWAEFDVYRSRFPDNPLVERFLAMHPDETNVNPWEGPFLTACDFRDVTPYLEDPPQLSGRVVSAVDGETPVSPVSVELFHVDTQEWVGVFESTDPDGYYSLDGIPDGEYYLYFDAYDAAADFVDELYDEQPCEAFPCEATATATKITIEDGKAIEINEDLAPR